MKELSDPKLDKPATSKLKLELTKLKSEHAKVIRLVNIAKPASLPPLVPQYGPSTSTGKDSKSTFPVFGKRKKIKVELPAKPSSSVPASSDDRAQEEEEEDEDDEEDDKRPTTSSMDIEQKTEQTPDSNSGPNETPVQDCSINSSETPAETPVDSTGMDHSNDNSSTSSSSSPQSDEDVEGLTDFSSIKSFHNTITFRKFEKILKKGLPPFAGNKFATYNYWIF